MPTVNRLQLIKRFFDLTYEMDRRPTETICSVSRGGHMRFLAIFAAFALTGCINAQVTTPSRALNPLPAAGTMTQRAYLGVLVKAHDENEVVFPQSWVVRLIGPGLATLGAQALEIEQTARDQRPDAARVVDTPVLSPEVLASAMRMGAEPRFRPMWVPVRVRGDVEQAVVGPSSVECPVATAPATEDIRSGEAVFCIYTQVALNEITPGEPPAPMILVIAGLLQSGDHQYVRTAALDLFARGYSVALVDVREHGGTFHAQPWLPSTLGLLEGFDVLGVARAIATVPIAPGTKITQFGALGFSAGGLFALNAAANDTQGILSVGVLAVSPLLDVPEALARMNGVRRCFLLDIGCINRRAMSFYFMDLLKIRMTALGLPAGNHAIGDIVPADYIDGRIRTFPGYADLPDPRNSMTAAMLGTALRTRFEGTNNLAVAIYTSHDDPVVGDAGAKAVADATDGVDAIGVFMPQRGGHLGLSVVSPAVTRAFMAGFFRSRHP